MTWIIFFYCLIQGFSEFLPISSQGHLIFFNNFFDITTENLSIRDMNIVAHLGSLFAIIIYYYKDCIKIFFSFSDFFRSDINRHAVLTKNILISSIPLFIFGYIVTSFLSENLFTSLKVIGWITIIFGVIFYLLDKLCLRIKTIDNISYITAIIIGIVQALAFMPGFSRSGLVISIMRLMGFNRSDSVNYSNFLSIPAISGAVIYLSYKNFEINFFNNLLNLNSFLILVLSFFFSFIFIHFLISWIRKSSFGIFMFYRIALGIFILIYAYDIYRI